MFLRYMFLFCPKLHLHFADKYLHLRKYLIVFGTTKKNALEKVFQLLTTLKLTNKYSQNNIQKYSQNNILKYSQNNFQWIILPFHVNLKMKILKKNSTIFHRVSWSNTSPSLILVSKFVWIMERDVPGKRRSTRVKNPGGSGSYMSLVKNIGGG